MYSLRYFLVGAGYKKRENDFRVNRTTRGLEKPGEPAKERAVKTFMSKAKYLVFV